MHYSIVLVLTLSPKISLPSLRTCPTQKYRKGEIRLIFAQQCDHKQMGGPIFPPHLSKRGMCVVYSSPLHFLTPPAPLGSLCFLSKGDPHSLGVGENGNKTLRMRAADFLL